MKIIPAIDLYKGKVVRLVKGDPAHAKVYSDDPAAVACDWARQGAELLHIVDLSAALGEGDNLQIIERMLNQADIKIQVGGGIRNIQKANELLALGAHRVIIGSKALDEDFLNKLISEVEVERIAIGVDVMNSCLAVEGWKKQTDFNSLDFIAYLRLKGIKWIIYTDISRDGTLIGADYNAVAKLKEYSDMNIIFSGGIAGLADLVEIRKSMPFIWGLISGKALYEGKITLKEAISACK